MNLTKSFPPADVLIEMFREVNYSKHFYNFVQFLLTVAAIVAAICKLLWENIQVMKFRTPDFLSDYFYFSVNMIGEPGDEIVGLSVWNRYIGLYDNNIVWGILNENGAL